MGNVRVKISGLNLPRLIGRLVDKNILVSDVIAKGRSVKFYIAESDLNALDKICKSEHKYYVILKRSGFKNFLSKIPYFLGALIATIISTTYICSFNQYVLRVNVSAESSLPFDLSDVNKILTENGVVAGMLKKDIVTKEIQKTILLNLENVSGCTVKLNGGYLNICVYPATEKHEVGFEDVRSKYNAVITFAESYSGELAVKKGDIVQIGDVLIKNNNGASGKVEGKVYFVSTIIYNENQQFTEKTGNIYKLRDINFCNLFSVKGKNRCPFSNYIVEKCDFYISPNCFIPIKIDEHVYYEVEIKNKIIPFEQVESTITNSAYQQALKSVPDKDKITNVTYSEVKDGIYTRVDCFIETIISLY